MTSRALPLLALLCIGCSERHPVTADGESWIADAAAGDELDPAFCSGPARKALVNGTPATIDNSVMNLFLLPDPCSESSCGSGLALRGVELGFGLRVEGSPAELRISVSGNVLRLPLSITSSNLAELSERFILSLQFEYHPCSPSSLCAATLQLTHDYSREVNEFDPEGTHMKLALSGSAIPGWVPSSEDQRVKGPFSVCARLTTNQSDSIRSLVLYDPSVNSNF